MKIKINSYWPAIGWLILSTLAFCIPGSALPKNNWLGKIYADKLIHIGLFAVMIFLWCVPLLNRQTQKPLTRLFTGIAIIFFSYGVLIELTQHFFVSKRSFDLGDILANTAGCIIGYLLMARIRLSRLQ